MIHQQWDPNDPNDDPGGGQCKGTPPPPPPTPQECKNNCSGSAQSCNKSCVAKANEVYKQCRTEFDKEACETFLQHQLADCEWCRKNAWGQ